jgi:hypothetical protein
MIQATYATLDAPPITGAAQACAYLLRKHAPLYMSVGGFQNRVSQPGKQGKPLTPQTKAKALEMLGCGLSTGQTANSLGISIQSVRNIKKEAERGPNYSGPIPTPTPTPQIALNRTGLAKEGGLA